MLSRHQNKTSLILEPRVVIILELDDVIGWVGQENRPVLFGGSVEA
jgi:hypothetical protein